MNKEVKKFVHYAITAFFATGVIWIHNCAFLKVYFLASSVVLLHWLTNDDKCCVSQLEDPNETFRYNYSQTLWRKFGVHFTEKQLFFVNKAILVLILILTYLRLNKECGFTFKSWNNS